MVIFFTMVSIFAFLLLRAGKNYAELDITNEDNKKALQEIKQKLDEQDKIKAHYEALKDKYPDDWDTFNKLWNQDHAPSSDNKTNVPKVGGDPESKPS